MYLDSNVLETSTLFKLLLAKLISFLSSSYPNSGILRVVEVVGHNLVIVDATGFYIANVLDVVVPFTKPV